ncbi:MAG TPA: HRDC domain-containing protein, partial [Gemmatimonadales bacterium]|nr:HRDC domain-containing protein [Gemmatimonadales bacterium]
DALGQVRGLPASLARRYGQPLVTAVGRALALPEHELPRRERGPRVARDPELEARVERLKTARNVVAQRIGLDPGVLCGKATLELIARARPRELAELAQVSELRRWQVTVLGEALLPALK